MRDKLTFNTNIDQEGEVSATNALKQTGKVKSEPHKRSFVPRSSESWNQRVSTLGCIT